MRTAKNKLGQDNFIFLVKNIQSHDNFETGYIQYHINTDEKEAILIYLFIHPNYQGVGYAKLLFQEMLQDVFDTMKKAGINSFHIKLDDMSDRYGSKDNIYLKMGFDYLEKDEQGNPQGPEMIQYFMI